MTATVHRFPAQNASAPLDVLDALRRVRHGMAVSTAAPEEPPPFGAQDPLQALSHCADALEAEPLARASVRVLRACIDVLLPGTAGVSPDAADVRSAVDRGLAAVIGVLEDAAQVAPMPPGSGGGPDPSIALLFPAYRSLRHLAGAQRVHPAELWPGVASGAEMPADERVSPRACDEAAVADLEAALLRSLRHPEALSFGRLSDLSAALGATDSSPVGVVWRLASAVFEAQRERLLEPDVYLKRLGAQLLSLARAASGAGMPVAASTEARCASLAHELWFFGAHAVSPSTDADASRLAALRACLAPRLAASPGVPSLDASAVPSAPPFAELPVEPGAAAPGAALVEARPRTLLEAVPGLPSWADLDLAEPVSAPSVDAFVPLDDAVKVIGPLRIEIERFNRFLVEADELSRQLGGALGEWSVAGDGPVGGHLVSMAQALAVEAAAIGHAELSALCAALAQALDRSAASGRFEARDGERFLGAHEEVSRLLHQFAAGFLRSADAGWLEALQARAGESSSPGVARPEPLVPLALQVGAAGAARQRLSEAMTALRARAQDNAGSALDLEPLEAVDRDVQTLAALCDDLCARWPQALAPAVADCVAGPAPTGLPPPGTD